MAEPSDDDVTAALAAVRRYCGWHVAPEEETTVTLDGPGSPLLVLPTLNVIDISAITECEVAVDLGFVKWSADGRVRKSRNYPLDSAWFGPAPSGWWTAEFQGITVTMTHGYDDAPDFDKAVQMVAESMAAAGLRDDQSMTMKQIDDVTYQWAAGNIERIVGAHLLAPYKLEKRP